MKTQLYRLLVAGFIALACQAAWSQSGPRLTADNDASLTLDELIAAVMAHNPDLKSLGAAQESAQYRVAGAGALGDPMLSYAAAPKTAGGPRGLQERVELSQPLPWPGKLALREERARAEARAHGDSLEDRRLQLAAAAKSLFGEWVYVHRTLSILREHRELLRELQRVAQTRYAAGKAPQQDALQAEVEEARLQTDIAAHRRHREEVQARINALLNRRPGIALPPPSNLPAPIALPPLETLQRTAVAQHPELKRIRARIEAARAGHDLAKKDYFPDFRLSAGYNSLWQDADQRWMIGISINLPFDFSNKRDAGIDAARAEVMRFDWQLSDREAQLLSELAQGRARVQEAQEVIGIYQQRLLPLAGDSLNAALADYRAGRGSFLNVIDAERAQLRAEDGLARAQADYLRELAALERYAARTLIGSFPTANPIDASTRKNP